MPCELDISLPEDVGCALDEEELQRVCEAVLSYEGVDRPCLLSLSVVQDDDMRELNRQWRGIDRPTDVISLECERPDDPDLADGEPCELGDIVLAPSYIARQAHDFGVSVQDETRLLLVHGVLHLLGYDHLSDAEAEVMEAREDRILELLGASSAAGAKLTRHTGEVPT